MLVKSTKRRKQQQKQTGKRNPHNLHNKRLFACSIRCMYNMHFLLFSFAGRVCGRLFFPPPSLFCFVYCHLNLVFVCAHFLSYVLWGILL